MTKSKKIDRLTLVDKIIKKASLPPGKNSDGYFTRKQLSELWLYLENIKQGPNDCGMEIKGEGTDDTERAAEQV